MQSLHVSRAWASFSHARAIPVLVAVFAVLMFACPRTAKAQSGSWLWTSQNPSVLTYSPHWGEDIYNVGGNEYYLTETASGVTQYIYALFAMDYNTGTEFGYPESGQGMNAIHTFTLVDEAPGLYYWVAALSDDAAPLTIVPNYRAPAGPFGYKNGP